MAPTAGIKITLREIKPCPDLGLRLAKIYRLILSRAAEMEAREQAQEERCTIKGEAEDAGT